MSDFWTRRKSAVEAEQRAEIARAEASDQAAAVAHLDEMSDAEALAALDLPDPETLGIGDDFQRFLAASVPARLKRRALRRLWRVNPVLANLDGLNDYDEDYRTVAAGPVRTAYEVGRGMMRRIEEFSREPEPATADEPEPELLPEAEDAARADAQVALAPRQPDETPPAGPARRRMHFTFETEGAA